MKREMKEIKREKRILMFQRALAMIAIFAAGVAAVQLYYNEWAMSIKLWLLAFWCLYIVAIILIVIVLFSFLRKAD